VNSSIIRSMPVRFVGALVALTIAGILLYLIGVINMYMIAWVVWVIEAIFG
jgi:hypothetical protein